MKTTVVGPVMDRDGMAHKRDLWARNRDGLFEARNRQWATPSHGLRVRQARVIPVDVGHDSRWDRGGRPPGT